MQFKDYYQILGVSKTASQPEIKSAFRKLARQHHPDVAKAKDKAAAEAKFKEINEAYEVLGDAEKRQKYDTLGADWQRGGAQPPPGWHQRRRRSGGMPQGTQGMEGMGGGDFDFNFGGTGFSDFFEAFFGSGGRGANPFASGRAAGSQRGVDIEADLMVPLEEALHGARRKITFQREGGEMQTYEITIPPGVREGQRIRLSGQGQAGLRGGSAGDLYLNVRLAPHPDFRVEGSDLIFELETPLWDAVLGATISIPTMEGTVRLKIPAGSQPGQRFRLKERGMPKSEGGRGDLYVMLVLNVPKTLTPEQRKLWEGLAALG
jgi:curved DNA-binding protein